MKIDREKLKAYASLGDRELWAEICKMAKSHGYSLPEAVPPHSDMERLRAIMRGEEKISIAEGMRILNSYKQKSK